MNVNNISGLRFLSPRRSGAAAGSMSIMFAGRMCVSFDFDDTLLLSERCKATTFDALASRYAGGTEILAAVPRDARDIRPGDPVPTRHTICRDLAAGLHHRGVRPGPEGESPDEFGARLCAEFSELVQTRLREADEVASMRA